MNNSKAVRPEKTIRERRVKYQRDLARALDTLVLRLSSKPQVHRIILFGSYATGRADLFTDLDLLVIMDSDLDFITRTAQLYADISVGVDLDLLVYTPQEFARLSARPFLRNIVEKGKVLYAK